MNGFSRNPEIITPTPGRRVDRFNFLRKSVSCRSTAGLFSRICMQHTRARCSLPAGGAVYPTQDSPVSNFSDATASKLSSCQNIQTAAMTETPLFRGISVNIKATSRCLNLVQFVYNKMRIVGFLVIAENRKFLPLFFTHTCRRPSRKVILYC